MFPRFLVFLFICSSFVVSIKYFPYSPENRDNHTLHIDKYQVLAAHSRLATDLKNLIHDVGAVDYLRKIGVSDDILKDCREVEISLLTSINLLNPYLESDSFDDLIGIGHTLLDSMQSGLKIYQKKYGNFSHFLSRSGKRVVIKVPLHQSNIVSDIEDMSEDETGSLSDETELDSESDKSDDKSDHESDNEPDESDNESDNDDVEKDSKFDLSAIFVREHVLLRLYNARNREFWESEGQESLSFPFSFDAVKAFIISSFFNYFDTIKLFILRERRAEISSKLNQILRVNVDMPAETRKVIIELLLSTFLDSFSLKVGHHCNILGSIGYFRSEALIRKMGHLALHLLKSKLTDEISEKLVFDKLVKPFYNEVELVLDDLFRDPETGKYYEYIYTVSSLLEKYEAEIRLGELEIEEISESEKKEIGTVSGLKFMTSRFRKTFRETIVKQVIDGIAFDLSPSYVPKLEHVKFVSFGDIQETMSEFRDAANGLIHKVSRNIGQVKDVSYFCPFYMVEWLGYNLETDLESILFQVVDIIRYLYVKQVVKLENHKDFRFAVTSSELLELTAHMLGEGDGYWKSEKALKIAHGIRRKQIKLKVQARLDRERLLMPQDLYKEMELFDWKGKDEICLLCRLEILHPSLKTRIRINRKNRRRRKESLEEID